MAIVKKRTSHVWITSVDGCENKSVDDYSEYVNSLLAVNGDNQKYLSKTPHNFNEFNCGSTYTLFSDKVNYYVPNLVESNIDKDEGRISPHIFERFVMYGLDEYYLDAKRNLYFNIHI